MTSRPHARKSHSLGAVIFLALALVLAATLAYQAADAARSHQMTAERTLNDYASFANWQLSQHAKNSLLTTLVMGLVMQASQVDPDDLERSLLTPYEVGAIAKERAGWCNCLGKVGFYFRFDWKDGTLQTTESATPLKVLRWARDTIADYVRALPKITDQTPLTFGSPDGASGPLRQLSSVLTNDSYAMIIGEPDGKPRLLALVVSRDTTEGNPVVVYGFETDPAPFLAPTFQFIFKKNSLLPPSLVSAVTEDSVLAISVADLEGHEVYRSPASDPLAPRALCADRRSPRGRAPPTPPPAGTGASPHRFRLRRLARASDAARADSVVRRAAAHG
jgi:hypothetical protein